MSSLAGEVSGRVSPDEPEQGRSIRRVMTLTACVGGVHALLFLLTYWLVSDAPGANASDAEIIEFYESDERWRGNESGHHLLRRDGTRIEGQRHVRQVVTRTGVGLMRLARGTPVTVS